MTRPSTKLIAEQIQALRDEVLARFGALTIAEQINALADYEDHARNGQAVFHPFHLVFG